MNPNLEVWRLIRFEWKRNWPDFILSCLSPCVLGLLAVMIINGNVDGNGLFHLQMSISETPNNVERNVTAIFLDSIFFGLFPFFALVLSTRMPVSLAKTTKIYVQRLTIVRTLPMSTRGFVRVRMFQGIIMLLLHFTVFFGTIYLITQAVYEAIPLFTYLPFIAIWLGYGLAVGGWFILMEWVIDSRALLKHLGLYLALVIGLIAFDMWLVFSQKNNSLVEQTILLAGQYPWIGPLAVLFGCVVLSGWSRLIEKRLLTRELN